jgi:hypothetical protein
MRMKSALRWVGCAAGVAAATAMAASVGCSSSSEGAVLEPEAGIDAATPVSDANPNPNPGPPREASVDAEAPGWALLWNVVTSPPTPEAGAGDAGSTGAGTTDASVDANVDSASDGGAASSNVPVPGATVCVYQRPSIPCVTTGQDGTFTLNGVPAQTDIVITIQKDGYRPVLRAVETASGNMDGTGNPTVLTPTTAASPVSSAPTAVPPIPATIDWQNKGQVTFFAIAPLPDAGNKFGGDPGATIALTPASGSGPYFFHDDGTYVPDASSLVGAAGEYVNLDPGNYVATFTDSNHTCAPISFPFAEWGYPMPPTSVKFPVLAGYITGPIGIFCTAK